MPQKNPPDKQESGAAPSILLQNMARVTADALGRAIPKPKSAPAVEMADDEHSDDDQIF